MCVHGRGWLGGMGGDNLPEPQFSHLSMRAQDQLTSESTFKSKYYKPLIL